MGITVSEITPFMAPMDQLKAVPIKEVRPARAGDSIITLRARGRAHALVPGSDAQGRQALAGIFAASQIARRLGVPIQTQEVACTFAEIEAALAGR